MSEHRATIRWRRATPGFGYEEYSRDHGWSFDGGAEVRASAAPAYRGSPAGVDPEEALVAALSSCHMLTFLAIASRKGWVVDSYEDEAVGHLEKNTQGKLAVTRVALRPKIGFGGKAPSAEELAALHQRAHQECFIANSVRAQVAVE